MVRSLKICLAAMLAVALTFPALAWAAPAVTATFDKPVSSKNIAYVYLHGLGNSHTVRVDLTAKDAQGKSLSWNGDTSPATFQMAPWLKDAANVAENTYTGNEMVVVISQGNNVLPTDASNTPDNYFIGTVMTSGDEPIFIGIPEIQVSTGTSPDIVTPGAGDDYLASVELNTSTPPDPNNPDDPNNSGGSNNSGLNGGTNNGSNGSNGSNGANTNGGSNGGTGINSNNGSSSKTTGGDLAKTGDEADLLVGGLLMVVAMAGATVVITAVSRKTRSKDEGRN